MTTAAPVAEIVLGRRLYMLPTRYGLLFTFILAVLLLAAINYNNGLAYALAFLLASIATMSMVHTHRNLSGLSITGGSSLPVFAGQQAEFTICLINANGPDRFGITVEQGKNEVARLDLVALEQRCLTIKIPTKHRGLLPAPEFVVSTQFPLGLLYSWSRRLMLDQHCLIYPHPAPTKPVAFDASTTSKRSGNHPDGDDFTGLRDYRTGDSPRHISWKIAARGQGIYTKQFGAGRRTKVWLDWNQVPNPDPEETEEKPVINVMVALIVFVRILKKSIENML